MWSVYSCDEKSILCNILQHRFKIVWSTEKKLKRFNYEFVKFNELNYCMFHILSNQYIFKTLKIHDTLEQNHKFIFFDRKNWKDNISSYETDPAVHYLLWKSNPCSAHFGKILRLQKTQSISMVLFYAVFSWINQFCDHGMKMKVLLFLPVEIPHKKNSIITEIIEAKSGDSINFRNLVFPHFSKLTMNPNLIHLYFLYEIHLKFL